MTERDFPDRQEEKLPRRRFLHDTVLGCGGLVLAATQLRQPVFAASHTDVLLLSCMDYRLVNATAVYMNGRGLRDKYDHIILAGASLGAVTKKYPAWNRTFWEHLKVAIDLHHIHTVKLLDHRDCGAYKLIFGVDFAADPPKETNIHAHQLKSLEKLIKRRYPSLEVELLQAF